MQHATKFAALFSSVFLLLIGHGLQLALIPLRASEMGWSAAEIGATGSFYFAGFLLGCWMIPKFVGRVGHIRVFSATTTLCGIALLLVGVSESVSTWCALRMLTGVGISGSYIIIESWLSAQSSDESRGQVLAVYSILVLGAMALGQYSISAASPLGFSVVIFGAILLSGSVMPLTLTQVVQPEPPTQMALRIREVLVAAPAAIGGAFFIGAMTGALFTLTPVVTNGYGLTLSQTAAVLVAMVLGGAVFQYPAGRTSDRMDRRVVMLALLSIGLVVSTIALTMSLGFYLLLAAVFLLGGAANVIYPLCLSHANDRRPGAFVEVGTAVLFVNSIGAIIGPGMASFFMSVWGSPGFFAFGCVVFALTTAWVLGCVLNRRRAPSLEHAHLAVAKSSPELLSLDPRARDTPTDDLPQG